ncbi:MAG: hypothetical protein ACT4PV_08385 [Planctomycetaceae bacterium]
MRMRELAILLCCALAACGEKKKEGDGGAHAHDAPGPNGGEVSDLGGGAFHLEILHDHVGGAMTVWVLDSRMEKNVPVPAPVVNLVTNEGPVQFTLEAATPLSEGKAECWKGSHAGLRTDAWDGRIVIVAGGKTFQAPLEGHAH